MNEISTIEPIENSLLNFVAHAVRDPSVDVTKLDALLRMQREIIGADARLQFNRAMSDAQAEMRPVTRDAVNDQTRSKYARLETIDAEIRPIYTRHGFAMSFDSEPIENGIRIICEVSHREGHSKTYRLEAGLDVAGARGNANKTPMHGLGSSVSYLRRYLKCMVWDLALANEDNDGNRKPADAGELSGEAQVSALYSLLAECSADPLAVAQNERAFLDKMALAQFRTIKDVPVGHYVRCKNALITKRNILQRRAELAAGRTV